MMHDVVPVHELVEVVIKTLDTRDPYTFEHSWRVAGISQKIAEILGLQSEYIEIIHIAAHLHDIGKIGVSDAVLNKSTRLNEEEYAEMKNHSRMGFDIANKTNCFRILSPYILHHHERWDGGGYPDGISGKAIPIGSRIIAVADSFDAITSSRPYHTARTYHEGFLEIERCRGKQFCPDSANALLKNRSIICMEIEKANEEIRKYSTETAHPGMITSSSV